MRAAGSAVVPVAEVLGQVRWESTALGVRAAWDPVLAGVVGVTLGQQRCDGVVLR
jgi:hypothetical protein